MNNLLPIEQLHQKLTEKYPNPKYELAFQILTIEYQNFRIFAEFDKEKGFGIGLMNKNDVSKLEGQYETPLEWFENLEKAYHRISVIFDRAYLLDNLTETNDCLDPAETEAMLENKLEYSRFQHYLNCKHCKIAVRATRFAKENLLDELTKALKEEPEDWN